MQLLTLSLTTLLSTLPLLTTAHMLLDNGAVWGRNSQGSSLENPLNRQSGGNWLHHGASKDTDKFMQLTPGQPKVLPIVCGEAMRKNKQAGDLCKAKSDIHMGGGCALAIAYKNPNDEGSISKDDFRVISVVHDCPTLGPFTHSFEIPGNLPACEECTCAWLWVPNPQSSADEMYMNTFNCKINGDNEGKVTGGKKPIYFGVEGGVKGSGGGRPMYNNKFSNGAQEITIG